MSNFQITQGTGTTIATDTGGGGENYQKIKLIDATTGATVGTGIPSNPLQVSLANTGLNGTPIAVDGSGVTQPISAVSLPLPTGAATETTLAGIKTDTDNLDVALSTRASESTVSNIQTQTDKLTFISSRLLVDGSGITQPISGTVAATQSGSWTVSLTNESIEIGTVDQGTPNTLANAWPIVPTDGANSQSFTTSGEAKVSVTQPLPAGTNAIGHVITDSGSTTVVTGNVTVVQATAANLNTTVTGTVAATQSGTWNINNISGTISLPTGASTSANQTNGNQVTQVADGSGHVWNIDPSGTGRVNVISSTAITANIGTTGGLALDATLTGGTQQTQIVQGGNTAIVDAAGDLQVDVNNFPANQTISGTVTSNQGTPNSIGNSWPVEVTDGTNILGTATHPIRTDPIGTTTQPVSGTVTANAGSGTFTVSGTVTANAGTGTFLVDGSAHTQPVSGTVTANIGTSGSLALDATVAKLTLAQGSTTSTQTGPLMQGAVTTAAPSYTTAQTSPLSLTTSGLLRVDGSGVTQPVSGTVTANAGTGTFTISGTVTANAGTNLNTSALALDTSVNGILLSQGSTTSGEKGPLIQGAVTTAAPSYTTAQTSPLSLTTAGALRTDSSATTQPVSGTVTANQGTANATPWNENVSQIGGTSVVTGGVSGLLAVAGNVASGASDSGNPIKIGGVAATSQPTAVTNGQRVNSVTDKLGRLIVVPNHVRDLVSPQTTTIASSTAETTFLTAVASTFLDITSLVITNSSAIAVSVTIRDATAGTVRAIFDLAANGGIVFNPPTAWKQTTVNNNWTATLSVNTVTVHIFAIAVQNI